MSAGEHVYLEVGSKRVFALAVDWPGWVAVAKTEADALQAVGGVAARYAAVPASVNLSFGWAGGAGRWDVIERVPGNATTDFGAPGVPPALDAQAITPAHLGRLIVLLRACWLAFDDAAAGQPALQAGPRGGGRSVAQMVDHILEAEGMYLAAIGGKAPSESRGLAHIHEVFATAVAARANGQVPDTGPRGGRRWPAAYAIRRTAWHALSHAWEIEDRRI